MIGLETTFCASIWQVRGREGEGEGGREGEGEGEREGGGGGGMNERDQAMKKRVLMSGCPGSGPPVCDVR